MTVPTVLDVYYRLCGYVLPWPSASLWWMLGGGSFFFGAVTLQCIFWIHVFVDPYACAFMAHLYEGLTGNPPAYCSEGHEFGAFFFMVIAFFEYIGCRMNVWRLVTFAVVILTYLSRLAVYGECSVSGVAFSACFGGVLGVLNVFAYFAVCAPLIGATSARSKLKPD